MGRVTKARIAAEEGLRAVSRGRRLDLALAHAVKDLDDRERRWVHEALYGTVRLRGRLDYLLDLHLREGISSLSPLLLDLLRLAAYQLLYMDGVPAYAAVSQAVDQARRSVGEGGARLANGVLRSLEREGGDPSRFPSFNLDPVSHLSSWGSHPSWLVRRWLERWEPEAVRPLVEFNNQPAPLFLRPLALPPEEAVGLAKSNGWVARALEDGVPCLEMGSGTDPAPLLHAIPGIVQDPGAALVTVYADVRAGSVVADLCAAPGGKALALAFGGAYVLAADRSARRLRLVRENVERLGGNVALVVADARRPPVSGVSCTLLDVPCSGTGTFRRHPDARWRLRPETMDTLVELQREILEAGAGTVEPGGVLVYSTCSLEPEENGDQVELFLHRHPEFALKETGATPGRFLDGQGRLSVLPQSHGFDGAFAARMVRRS